MYWQLAAHVDKWIEEQVIKYDDRKWGSRVSQKLFMDKEYVLKHIRNKHKDKIDEQKQKVCACYFLATAIAGRVGPGPQILILTPARP